MRIWPALPIAVMLLLVGCGGAIMSDGVPAPITLANTAPSQLEATVGVTIGGYDPAQRETTEIAVQFLSNGRLVQFQKGETLACAGAEPVRLATGFDQRYPTAAVVGKPFRCTYTSGKTSGVITFQVPMAPVILSPTEGAAVAREAATPIRFQAAGGSMSIVALTTQAKAIASVSAPGVASVDTSQFPAGLGSITLNQSPAVTHTSGAAFASFHVYCTAIAQTSVIWR